MNLALDVRMNETETQALLLMSLPVMIESPVVWWELALS